MKMYILDRYIIKSHVAPYLFGLALITFVFVMDFIFRYLDLFIGKGVDFFVVLEFFVLSLGHMFALIIPMAVMPATLMAFGQLTSENEVTAMKAMGVSLYRMILPVLLAAILLAGGLVFYNNRILPESNHRLMNLMIDIGKMKPTLEIRENIFSEAVEGYTILVREKDDRTGRIEDIQIFEKKRGGIPKTIIARRGTMRFIAEEGVLRFELEDGEIHDMPDPKDVRTYRRTTFKHLVLNIQDIERKLKRSQRSHRGDREMSAAMMRARIVEIEQNIGGVKNHMHLVAAEPYLNSLTPHFPVFGDLSPSQETASPLPGPTPRKATSQDMRRVAEQVLQVLETETHVIESNRSQISRYGVEIHKKYSIPFSCIIFILLGAPLAIRSGKRGMTMAVGFSILFFLVYYVFLISGEKLADRRFVAPWLAMWLPNILFTVSAMLLLHSTVREAQTINWKRFNILQRIRRRGTADTAQPSDSNRTRKALGRKDTP